MTARLLPVSSCLILLVSCGGGGGGGGQPLAEVSTLGGVVEVTEGPLAGVRLELPPGAAPRPLPIRLAKTRALAIPGYRPLGDCFRIGPIEARFHLPALLTIPYDQDDQTATEIVVLAHDVTGEVIELGPVDNPEPGVATLRIGELGSFWVAERAFGGLSTADLLPLEDGNEWTFEGGLTARIALTFEEPNLLGEFIYRLDFVDADGGRTGLYLERDFMTGAIRYRGRYAADPEGQQIVHAAAPFLLPGVTLGRTVRSVHEVTGHEPFGGPATIAGTAFTESLATQPGEQETQVGIYGDVLDLEVHTRLLRRDGVEAEIPLTLRLARYVGPIAVRFGGSWLAITGGIVGGLPL